MSAFNSFKGRCRSFTVVELLVVVAIMGIILGTSLPSFLSLIGGGGVSNGASSIASQLRYTRQYALSKRMYVALVIADEYSLPAENKNIYRAFRTAVVKRPRGSSSESFKFVEWVDGSSWSFLPTKVYARCAMNFMDLSVVDLTALDGREMGEASGIVFSPAGNPLKSGATANKSVVEVGEGVWNGKKINDLGSEANKVEVVVHTFTGRVEVEK